MRGRIPGSSSGKVQRLQDGLRKRWRILEWGRKGGIAGSFSKQGVGSSGLGRRVPLQCL